MKRILGSGILTLIITLLSGAVVVNAKTAKTIDCGDLIKSEYASPKLKVKNTDSFSFSLSEKTDLLFAYDADAELDYTLYSEDWRIIKESASTYIDIPHYEYWNGIIFNNLEPGVYKLCIDSRYGPYDRFKNLKKYKILLKALSTPFKLSITECGTLYVDTGITGKWSSDDSIIATITKKKESNKVIWAREPGETTVKCVTKNGTFLFDITVTSIDFLPFAEFCMNSVGGIEPDFQFANIYWKTIKYIYADLEFFNTVGDPAKCEILGTNKRTIRFTGPIDPDKVESAYYDPIIYNSTTGSMKLKNITIEFMDGSAISLKATYTIKEGKPRGERVSANYYPFEK